MKAVVVLLVALWVVCEAKKEGFQEDFEFVEDGKDRAGTSGGRRTWMLDPDNALCGLLRCGRREVCLLQDRFTAVCVNKAEVTRNGDKIIPLKDAEGPASSDEELPKSWDALNDYDDEDDYEDDEDYDEDEEDEYMLEDEDEEDVVPGSEAEEEVVPGSEAEVDHQTIADQKLNRRPFAEKLCPACPVVKPVFLCGSDNRTYSSLCRLHYHNCIHEAVIKVACKGFCPCKNPSQAKKERQRERLDAYITKLRNTKDETSTPAPASDAAQTSPSGGRKHGGARENGGEKHNNRVRSRFSKSKNGYKKNGRGSERDSENYSKFNKYGKNSYRKMDKYNVHRQWPAGRDTDPIHPATNTVWGPNECTQDALEAMGNRMLDWFSVIMADTRSRSNSASKAPSWCKPEVSWMLGHLDADADSRLSVKELYQLEHDDHERCIKPFIDRCDLDRDIFLSAREWCKCFDKSERPCAALRKASKGLLGGYIPECDSEGYYQATQCHAGAGVCWCVDRHGVELPNTRTRGTPNCDAIVNSQDVNSNHVDDDAEEGDDDMDTVEGSADMPLDI